LDWLPAVILLFGGLLVLLLSGLPVAFSFTLINIVGAFILWGGELGLRQLIVNMFSSVSMFALIAVPLFTLMGEVMLHSGVA
jgi:TRAP-type mannitol/chloroaromatic compound transport system permease large subunit